MPDHEPLDIQKCIANLQQVSLFAGLNEEQYAMVAGLCDMQWRSRGDILMRETEEARGFYILLRGEVSISKRLELPHMEHGRVEDRILTTLDAEGCPVLGETSIVGGRIRGATVRCASACVLYRIEARRLAALMEDHKEIGYYVYRRLSEVLCGRLESANIDVVKLSAALVFSLEAR